MSPDQLCAKGSESGHQKALFAWAAMACYKGFDVANTDYAYTARGAAELQTQHTFLPKPVPELKWLHAIPNGGKRDARTAALMKAEGVRSGVADVCLPVARHGKHGLYIEMKKPTGGRASDSQLEFRDFCHSQGYVWELCVTWQQAAAILQKYLS